MTTPLAPETPGRTRILPVLLLQMLVVLACVLITTAIAAAVQERSIRTATTERVLAVSESLAALEQVRSALTEDGDRAADELQPLADLIESSSGVDYVVITDAEGIRVTHPTPAERGQPVSTDPGDVLAGATFVGTETGTLGATLRAKVPIVADGQVIGAASVGILESEIAADFQGAVWSMVPWVVGSIIVGWAVSAGAIAFVGRRVRDLEAHAQRMETQARITEALRDQTHEFRTRMHVVRGLIAEGDGPGALDYIARIAPVTTQDDAAIDIDDPALRAVLSAEAVTLHARGGMFEIDPLTSIPRGVLSDADVTIISNLCRNAVEAAAGRVRLLAAVDHGRLRVEVDDDGSGVPAAERHRIFERGVSSKAHGGERGVGLDLVRRLVTRRGGTITVGTSPWSGARFVVDCPLDLAAVRR